MRLLNALSLFFESLSATLQEGIQFQFISGTFRYGCAIAECTMPHLEKIDLTADGNVSGSAPIRGWSLIWILVVVALWGGNSPMVKIVVRDTGHFWGAFLRFVQALAIIWIVARLRGTSLAVSLRELPWLILMGLGFFLQIITFNYGAHFTEGARISVIIYGFPLLVPLIAHVFLKGESLRAGSLLGAAVAFCGLLLVFVPAMKADGRETLKGDLIQLLSTTILSFNVVYNKWLSRRFDELRIVFWEILTGCVLFLVCALAMEPVPFGRFQWDSTLAILYQGILVGGFCFISWQFLIKRHSSSDVSVWFFAAPLFGIILSAVLLGERPGLLLGAGGLLVGAGIYISTARRSGG